MVGLVYVIPNRKPCKWPGMDNLAFLVSIAPMRHSMGAVLAFLVLSGTASGRSLAG